MSTATINSPLMNTRQVGKILGRTEQSVRAMVKNGEIACVRRNSRGIQFTQQHIDDWIAAHEVPAKTAPKTAQPTRNPKYTR